MSLTLLADNSRTDKNTVHSYLDLYQKLLEKKKHTALNVLEVGIFEGGSIKLWSDFFLNATVHGVDRIDISRVWEEIKNKKNIVLHTSVNGYDEEFVKTTFLDKNITFDFILDDGSHQLEDMKRFVRLYSQLLKEDGILIIEDVQEWEWFKILTNETPEYLKDKIKCYDLRYIKNRGDDMVFTIDKSGSD